MMRTFFLGMLLVTVVGCSDNDGGIDCVVNEQCPSGVCIIPVGEYEGTCLEGQTTPVGGDGTVATGTGLAGGEACLANIDCASGLCEQVEGDYYVCAAQTATGTTTGTAAGATVGGTLPTGSACTTGTECVSGACVYDFTKEPSPQCLETRSSGLPAAMPLDAWEDDAVGSWYHYSSTGDEYRIVTFNSDRTGCYYEAQSLADSATRENEKCYQNWFMDDAHVVYSSFAGGAFTHIAEYEWHVSTDAIRIVRTSVSEAETTQKSCSFCTF